MKSTPLLLFLLHISSVAAGVTCVTDRFCQQQVHPDSICNEQDICSNPYASGCLQHKLGPYSTLQNKRACNSNDPLDAAEMGICEVSPFNYPEIRIHNANWESSIFYAWALQIILSERLQVPVTIGLNGDSESSFYDNNNNFAYSSEAYNYAALEEANRNGGDCTATTEPCYHVMPEVWNGQVSEYTKAVENGVVDPVEGDGQVGKISWFVPKYTAQRHQDLVSFYGLSGDENRAKLAEIFKRPTTWKEYCDLVSLDQCATPDDVAARYPGEGEEVSYFAGEGAYIGHFRATEKSDCETNEKCTGHIVAPPCTWSSFIDSQIYWNEIALESNGDDPPNGSYSYGEMIAIWKAANATKSDVIMWWFAPDGTFKVIVGLENTHSIPHMEVSSQPQLSSFEERTLNFNQSFFQNLQQHVEIIGLLPKTNAMKTARCDMVNQLALAIRKHTLCRRSSPPHWVNPPLPLPRPRDHQDMPWCRISKFPI